MDEFAIIARIQKDLARIARGTVTKISLGHVYFVLLEKSSNRTQINQRHVVIENQCCVSACWRTTKDFLRATSKNIEV